MSINPQAATVSAGNSVQLSALVQNTGNTSLNWSISPDGAQIGSISSTGLYTAPASVSSLSVIAISATSVADSTAVAQALIAVDSPSPNDAAIQGPYAFSLFLGNLGNAASFSNTVQAGSIVADGSGNITMGVVDQIGPDSITTGAALTASSPVIGAYMIGSDNQGQMALLPTQPIQAGLNLAADIHVFQVALGSFNQGRAARAFVDSELTSSFPASVTIPTAGTMLSQDNAAFALSTIQGSFAFGVPVTGSEALAGAFQADGAGNLTSGSIDVSNPGGVYGSELELSDAPFSGTYSLDSSNGRGTASLNIPTVGTVSVVFYVVSAGKLLWLGSTPNGGVFNGSALVQSGGPFSLASLNGTSVFSLSASAGVMTADGNGNVTGNVDGSEDESGNTVADQPFTGTYMVSANGRGTLSTFDQSFVLWLVSQNSAFIVEAPGSSAVQNGLLEPQAAGPFGVTSISGSFASGGNSSPLDETIGFNLNGLFGTFSSDGAGNLTGSLAPAPFPANSCPNTTTPTPCPFAASYSVSASGRGTINASVGSTASSVFYMISPNAFVTTGSLGLLFFGP